MKLNLRSGVFLLLLVFFSLFFGCSSSKKLVKKTSESQNSTANVEPYASVVGTWPFVVKGVPQGDVRGDMIISVNDGMLKGVVNSGGTQSDIRDIRIEDNVLSGVFDYNEMVINMKGVFSGSSYNGKVETQGYSFPMTATKN